MSAVTLCHAACLGCTEQIWTFTLLSSCVLSQRPPRPRPPPGASASTVITTLTASMQPSNTNWPTLVLVGAEQWRPNPVEAARTFTFVFSSALNEAPPASSWRRRQLTPVWCATPKGSFVSRQVLHLLVTSPALGCRIVLDNDRKRQIPPFSWDPQASCRTLA